MYKLIIVDDELWTRDLVRNLGKWQELGIDIVGEADNGMEALKLIQEKNPDLIVMDMQMPELDGVELLIRLEQGHPGIRKIIVSGYDDFEYTKQAIRSKVNEYILKPFDGNELNHALMKCIQDIESEKQNNAAKIYELTQSIRTDVFNLIVKFKKTILPLFNDLNLDEVKKFLVQFCSELKEIGDLSAGDLNKVYAEFILLVRERIVDNGYNLDEVFSNISKFSSDYNSAMTVDGLYECLMNLFEIIIVSMVNQRQRKNKKKIYEIKEFIDRNFAGPVTLESLSNTFFLSREYLSRTFKEVFGKNLTEYIIELRMNTAKEIILSSDVSIKSVAQMVGYSDTLYFHKLFKKHFGLSPGKIRNK